MGCSWTIWLFALPIILNRKICCSTFESLHLQRILLTEIPIENKVAKCVLSIVDEVDKRLTENIEINIEANSPIIKQEFLNTVVQFITSNNRSTFEMVSNNSGKYKIYFRMYFIESLESLENSLTKRHHNFFPKDHFYTLVILPKGIPDPWLVLKAIFNVFWKLSIINVNALIEDQIGNITLYTYFPFKEHRCKDISPQIINRYLNGSFQFKTSHFPNKIRNFWKCSLNVVAFKSLPFIYIEDGKIKGYDGLVLEHLANLLNFSVKIIISQTGEIFDNHTYTGGFKMLNEGIADLMIADNICTSQRSKFFAGAHYNTYYKNLVFRTDVVASSLKTLVLPFDLCTWLVILCISVYKCFAQSLWKHLFKGIKHRKRTYNWLIIGPYIASFLIIRSLYEGSIFKILHNRPIGVRPNSFDEAIQQGYKFMASPGSYYIQSIIPELKNHIVVFNGTSLTETFFQTDGKYVFLASKFHMAMFSRGRPFFMAQQPLLTSNTCMYMPKLSYISRELNIRIQQLREHGHMRKINTLFSDIHHTSRRRSSKSQSEFSIKQLFGAFQMYFIFISMSLVIFILEMLSKRNKRLKIALEVFERNMEI